MKAIKSILLGVAVTCLASPAVLADPILMLPGSGQNEGLGAGSYQFAHSNGTGAFSHEWTFSVGQLSNAEITLDNAVLFPEFLPDICDPVNFCVSVQDLQLVGAGFDDPVLLLDGDTLSVSGLAPDVWYTLTISGVATGVIGGQYDGRLNISVVAVPSAFGIMGSSALFGLFFAMRQRRSAVHQ